MKILEYLIGITGFLLCFCCALVGAAIMLIGAFEISAQPSWEGAGYFIGGLSIIFISGLFALLVSLMFED